MDDTGFLLLGMLVASILILLSFGMVLYVAFGTAAKKE